MRNETPPRAVGNGRGGVLPPDERSVFDEKAVCILHGPADAGMTACGKDTSGGGQSVDLRAAYEAAIAQVNEELGDNAPALLEETAVELLNGYYPGIADIQLKQSVFFLSPTATSCEVAMVEVADSADAAKVRDIFQTRVDTMANDTMYPDEAAMWKNSATVSVNGSYVVLEVLPEGCTVPDAFLARF